MLASGVADEGYMGTVLTYYFSNFYENIKSFQSLKVKKKKDITLGGGKEWMGDRRHRIGHKLIIVEAGW